MQSINVLAKCPVRTLLRTTMADYTSSSSVPRNIKGGHVAVHITDIGKVWFTETTSFASTMTRFKNRAGWAKCVMDAWARKARVELWFLTQPERFNGAEFRDMLQDLDLLADRKRRVMDGPGRLYCIQHRASADYFVLSDRTGVADSTLLHGFLARLQLSSSKARNQQLSDFITANVSDIMTGARFEISEICTFEDNEDLWLRRQVYIDERKYGKNLNLNNVD